MLVIVCVASQRCNGRESLLGHEKFMGDGSQIKRKKKVSFRNPLLDGVHQLCYTDSLVLKLNFVYIHTNASCCDNQCVAESWIFFFLC